MFAYLLYPVMLFLLVPSTPLLQFYLWLSGESIPVMKTPLPVSEVKYSPESQRRHTLFCGTQLIQAKGGCPSGKGTIAVVTRTGNSEHRMLLQWVHMNDWSSGINCDDKVPATNPYLFFVSPQAFLLLKVISSALFSTHSQLTSVFMQMPWSFYFS